MILAFLGTSINYVDRANLGVAAPFMGRKPHLNSAELGLILGVFFWTYAIFQLVSGYLVDRIGPRIMYSFVPSHVGHVRPPLDERRPLDCMRQTLQRVSWRPFRRLSIPPICTLA